MPLMGVLSEGCCDFAMTLIFLQEEKSSKIDLIDAEISLCCALTLHRCTTYRIHCTSRGRRKESQKYFLRTFHVPRSPSTTSRSLRSKTLLPCCSQPRQLPFLPSLLTFALYSPTIAAWRSPGGNARFTTDPSRSAMLDPMMVATSVSRLRLCDRAASNAGVASMTPASQGGRVNPTIGCSRKDGYRRSACTWHLPLATSLA